MLTFFLTLWATLMLSWVIPSTVIFCRLGKNYKEKAPAKERLYVFLLAYGGTAIIVATFAIIISIFVILGYAIYGAFLY